MRERLKFPFVLSVATKSQSRSTSAHAGPSTLQLALRRSQGERCFVERRC